MGHNLIFFEEEKYLLAKYKMTKDVYIIQNLFLIFLKAD